MIRSTVTFICGFFLAAGCALAQVSDDFLHKATKSLQEKASRLEVTDLIVVYDDKTIQAEAEELQFLTGLSSHHRKISDYKVGRYHEKKLEGTSIVASGEASVLKEYSHLPVSFIRIHSGKAMRKLLANPHVVGVYEDAVVHRAFLAQSLPLIGQPRAAAVGASGSGTTVAVLDQRVDYTQPDFGSCTSPGVPSSCKVVVARDAPGLADDGLGYQDGHGSNVAGIVVAVAPGTKIISLNVFKGETANNTDVIAAINWCIQNAATYNIVAMNMSIGDESENSTLSTTGTLFSVFSSARAAGILPIVAAGNSGHTHGLSSWAAVTGAVSVGAVYDSAYSSLSFPDTPCTDAAPATDKVSCFSNSGSILTLFAPGCRIDSGGNSKCGTSQAAPHVAGAVAVLRSAFPSETLAQTVARLTNGVPVTDGRNGITKPRLSLPMALGLPACSFGVSPTSQAVGAAAATGSLSVTSASGCTWSARSNANWITILSGSSGAGGQGTVRYSVAANGATTPRTGTISVGGQVITVTQSGRVSSPSSASNIWLIGNYGYQMFFDLNSVTLNADEIANLSFGTTGTLRLELWLTRTPYSSGQLSGWRVATQQISIPGSPTGQLGPYQSFLNINATVPLVNLPQPGNYYANLVIGQYDPSCGGNDHFCMAASGGFSNLLYIPDVSAPTVPAGLTATTAGSTQVNLAWSASSDDVAVTAYKIFSNGVLIGRVSTAGANVSSLAPATTYQFRISACDAVGNCSAQSAPASATTSTSAADILPMDGLWVINTEAGASGRGFQIEVRNGTLVFTYYGYDGSGSGLWALSSGAMSGGSFSGSMSLYRSGVPLGGTYAPAVAAGSAGTVSINFTSPTAGTITFPGESQKAISKYDFSGATAPSVVPANGLWIVNAEAGAPGRGFQIEQRNGLLVLTYYGYLSSGGELWTLSAGNMIGSSFSGTLDSYRSGTVLGGTYHAATSGGSVGAVSINFTSATTGTITFPGEAPKAISKFVW